MGLRCFLVAMLLAYCSQSAFARNCSQIFGNLETFDCSECIRCGGLWCNDPKEIPRCVQEKSDGWCKTSPEEFEDFIPDEAPGIIFDPYYVEKMAVVAATSVTDIMIDKSALPKNWVPQNPLEKYEILNTTQSNDVHIKVEFVRDQTNVKTTRPQMKLKIKITIGEQFCLANSTRFEHVFVKVGLNGIDEGVTMKYRVPCACLCQETVEMNAAICSGHGDFSCGVCHCKEERFGTYCEKTKENRGDIQSPCGNNSCFGNGICKDGICECFNEKNIEGSKYFDKDNNCEDLCSATSTYTHCLKNPEPGFCRESNVSYAYIDKVDNTSLAEVDGEGRRVWVRCNVTLPDCGLVEYAAMKIFTNDHVNDDHLMVFKTCSATIGAFGAGKRITIPVVFCVLALVAAAAAGAGYMVWKARGPPPLPLADPQYANIDAEDCIGENPLYKPPTSSFKNPMYGKC